MSQWLGPVGAWFYVIGFLILGMFCFSVGMFIVTNTKKVDDWLGWLAAVLGLVFFMIAGHWAEQTFVFRLIGWLQQFEIVVLIGFAYAFWKVLRTPFAAIPDKFVPKATIGLELAIAWLLLPSMIRQGYIPGAAGDLAARGVTAFSGTVNPYTRWFG